MKKMHKMAILALALVMIIGAGIVPAFADDSVAYSTPPGVDPILVTQLDAHTGAPSTDSSNSGNSGDNASNNSETLAEPATPQAVDSMSFVNMHTTLATHWSLLNLILGLLAIIFSVIALTHYRAPREGHEEQGEEEWIARRLKAFTSALFAVFGTIVFLFTEDLSKQLVLLDIWTFVMLGTAVGSAVFAMRAMRRGTRVMD